MNLFLKFTNNCIINCYFVLSLSKENFNVITEYEAELADFDLQGKNALAKEYHVRMVGNWVVDG